jgi:hypothetical protein
MLDLRIPIKIAAVEAVKAYLLGALPEVKSSHRVEAAARGLGFHTYAAMLHAAKLGDEASKPADGGRFASYLSEHGFFVPPIHLYRAVAHVAVAAVMEKVLNLSTFGYGFGEPQWDTDAKRWETTGERYASFVKHRAEFLFDGVLDEFLLALAFVQRIPSTKTIRTGTGSYHLKHIAEEMPITLSDGTNLGPGYVANGALIAAALHAGFRMKTDIDHLGYDAINVSFNMSKRAIDDLDCEIRPKGGLAQDRKYLAERRGSRGLYA